MATPKRRLTVDDARQLALALPETSEKPSYGTPGFRVRDKLFARVLDEDSIVVFVDLDQRALLLEAAPAVFAVTPHYQSWPMMIIRLAKVSRGVLEDMLLGAWRQRAPEKLLAGASGPKPKPARRQSRRR